MLYSKFASVLSIAYDKTFTFYAIKETFRKTRIFLFNPKAIDNQQLAPKEPNQRKSRIMKAKFTN